MTEPSRAARASDPSPRPPAAIPSFALYGEAPAPAQERLHIETIQSRSRLYQWEIRPHVHQGLCQILWVQRGRAKVTLDEVCEAVEGPAAIATPPGVVHGYQFSPGTDGLVLTFSVRFLVEGEPPSAREAFKTLFLKPSSRGCRRIRLPQTGSTAFFANSRPNLQPRAAASIRS
jgi:AraC family transcriptional regulator, transcriptional activator of pobA